MENEKATQLSGLPLLLASIGVSIATFLMVLDYSIANVSIPYIAGDLAVSANEGVYVITAFAVGSAILLPVSGWLTKRLGLIRTMVLSVAGFTFFSWVCGVSASLTMLVISRFLQGLAAGPMVPLSQTIIVRIFPHEKKEKALGVWSTVVIVAPIVGPILGGYISYDINWRWIFFLNIPLGALSCMLILLFLKNTETEKQKIPADWLGLILLALFVSNLQFLLDKGEQYDWFRSPIIRTCGIVSFISFVFLIAWENFAKNPVIQLSLLKIRSFSLSLLFMFVCYGIYFGSVVLVPLWLQKSMGYTPIWAGVAVAPIGLVPLFLSNWMGGFVKKRGSIVPLSFCFGIFAIACFSSAFFTTDVDIWHVAITRFLLGLGILFMVIPLFALSLRDLTDENMASGTGVFHFVRAMAGGIGTSIFTTIWIRRAAFHHSNFAANVTLSRPPVEGLFEKFRLLGFNESKSWAMANEMVNKQAEMLSLNDCFFLMGWIFIFLYVFLYLGRKKKVAYTGPHDSTDSSTSQSQP